MIYPLVRELVADSVPVAVTCWVLEIARQGGVPVVRQARQTVSPLWCQHRVLDVARTNLLFRLSNSSTCYSTTWRVW